MGAPSYLEYMRGLALFAIVAAALVACSSGSAGGVGTSLRVTFWEDGTGKPDAVWTLRCGPPRGSLARPARACRNLATGGARLFAETPPNVACTQLYGGPQKARIVGIVGGRRVWTTVSRTDGCEIARWQRLSPWLLPPGGVT
jgi:hypothetical protein